MSVTFRSCVLPEPSDHAMEVIQLLPSLSDEDLVDHLENKYPNDFHEVCVQQKSESSLIH